MKTVERRWRIGEKEKEGAVVKRKPWEPRKEEESGERKGKEEEGRRNQSSESGSNAKDWWFLEDVLWRP